MDNWSKLTIPSFATQKFLKPIGYWLLPECNGIGSHFENSLWISILNTVVKVALLWFNLLAFAWGGVASSFIFGNLQVLCTLSLKNLLTRQREKVESISEPEELTVGYRTIQLESTLINEIQQKSLITNAIVGTIICQAFSF